jgi:hypothetical protein
LRARLRPRPPYLTRQTRHLGPIRIAPADAALFEDDDLIPVCLGAANASLLNHWPQLLRREWRAAKKDVLERQLCTASRLTQ